MEPWSPLFAVVFEGCVGLVELRAFAQGKSTGRGFFPPADDLGIARFAVGHQDEDVYFGVATRRDATGGDLAHCYDLGAVFCDIDFKHTPPAVARARLARIPLAPSAVVESGGGLHVYFGLREPFRLPEQAPAAKTALRRLAITVGGDLAAAEPARVLRLPGLANHKYHPPRVVRVLETSEDVSATTL